MTHPHHETALMLLRAAGFDVGDGENILFRTNVEWRLINKDFLAMAAAVDAKMEAREKVLREALERIADGAPKTDPDLTSESSFGNYDDVFSDGMTQVHFYNAAIARAALEAKP